MGKPDFIGIGAQRAGTTWIARCLDEHPSISIPVKELHFFSRNRNWRKGYEWYERKYSKQRGYEIIGEYSTSYLSDSQSPKRIIERYPNIKIITSLRNPIDRAFSNYINDIQAGTVRKTISFIDALKLHPEYVNQGLYSIHIKNFYSIIKKENILILIYEDSLENPIKFIQSIYRFLGVDQKYVPTSVKERINARRIPRSVYFDKLINRSALKLDQIGLRRIVMALKYINLHGYIHRLNSKVLTLNRISIEDSDKDFLLNKFRADIEELSLFIGRDLVEWVQ